MDIQRSITVRVLLKRSEKIYYVNIYKSERIMIDFQFIALQTNNWFAFLSTAYTARI